MAPIDTGHFFIFTYVKGYFRKKGRMKKAAKKPKRNPFSLFIVGFVIVFVALVSLLIGSTFIKQSQDDRSEAAGTRCVSNKAYSSELCFGKLAGDIVNNGKSVCKAGKKLGAFVACSLAPISVNANKNCLEDTSKGSDARCFDKKDGDIIENGKSMCRGVSDYGAFTVCKVVPYGTSVGCSSASDAKCKGKAVEAVVGEHQICLPDTNGPQDPGTGQVKCYAGCEKNYKLSGGSCVPSTCSGGQVLMGNKCMDECKSGSSCTGASGSNPTGSSACASKSSGGVWSTSYCCPSGQTLNSGKTACVTTSGGGSGSGGSGSSGSGGSGSGGSGSGGNGGSGGGGGNTQPPTMSATVRGNYCSSFTAAVSGTSGSVLSPGASVTFTSAATAQANNFWYIVYNRDNLNAPNDPKPVCVTSGGDVDTVVGPCPSGSHQLIFLNPSKSLRTSSGNYVKSWEQVFLTDTNWSNKRVNRVQINAYFSVTGGVFSLPSATCVKNLDSGYIW